MQRGFLLLGLAQFQGAAQAAALEDRQADRGAEGVGVRGPFAEVAELQALDGAAAGEGDAGEEIGLCGADRGGGGVQRGFGGADVRAAAGEFAGHADRHARRHRGDGARGGEAGQAGAGGLAEQQGDGVAEAGLLFLQGGDLGFDGGDLGAGIGDVEVGGHAAGFALARQGVVLAGDVQVLADDGQFALDAAQRDVGAGEFGRGADQEIAAHVGAGFHLRLAGFDQAGDAAPEIDLPGQVEAELEHVVRAAQAGVGLGGAPAEAVGLGAGIGGAGGGDRGDAAAGLLLSRVGGVGVGGGALGGFGDAELGAGLHQAEIGGAQVEVGARQGLLHLVEHRVAEQGPPAGVEGFGDRGAGGGGGGGLGEPGGGFPPGLRAFEIRAELRAARQRGRQGCQQPSAFHRHAALSRPSRVLQGSALAGGVNAGGGGISPA